MYVTYYTFLGVKETASQEEIKEAFRKKVLECHPDLYGGDSQKAEQFIKIKEAYDCLSDLTKRRRYDLFLSQYRKRKWEESVKDTRYNNYENQRKNNKEYTPPKRDSSTEFFTPELKRWLLKFFCGFAAFIIIMMIVSHDEKSPEVNKLDDNEYFDGKDKRRLQYGQLAEENYDLGDSQFSQSQSAVQTDAEEDSKWLYGKLKDNGLSISYDDFKSSLSNEVYLKMYYDTALKLGLEVGSYDDFTKLFKSKGKPLNQKRSNGKNLFESKPYNDEVKVEEYDNSTYTVTNYSTGDMPYKGYWGNGMYDKSSLSELCIKNYSDKDAVVLLLSIGVNSDKVYRHAFISAYSSYTMYYIPMGTYYVKIMQGKDWNIEKDNGGAFPKGGFMKSLSYSKTDLSDPFSFIPIEKDNGIEYPAYTITLHKIVNGNLSEEDISKSDFFER